MSESHKATIFGIVGQFKRLFQIWDELQKADNLIEESREEANAITLEMNKLKEKLNVINEKLLKEQSVRLNDIDIRQELKHRSFVKNMTQMLSEIDECKHLFSQLRPRICSIKFKIADKDVTLKEIFKELDIKIRVNEEEALEYLKLLISWNILNNFFKIAISFLAGFFGLHAAVYAIFGHYLTKNRIKEIAEEFAKFEMLDLLLEDAYVEIEMLKILFDELYNSPKLFHSDNFYNNLANSMVTFHTGYTLSVVPTELFALYCESKEMSANELTTKPLANSSVAKDGKLKVIGKKAFTIRDRHFTDRLKISDDEDSSDYQKMLRKAKECK